MEYNLQFFADEDLVVESAEVGAEDSEIATPNETVGAEAEEATSTEDENTIVEDSPKVDANAIAAAARRKAEAEAREAQNRIDAEYTRRFGNYMNPITHKPIRSQKDYLDALDAQEQLKAENEMRERGIDPNLLNTLVENSPIMREAKAVIEANKVEQVKNEINSQIAELSQLDASITSFDKVPANVVEKAMKMHVSLADAYKMINYGKVTSATHDAIVQNTVNQVKGKSHLTPITGVTNTDNSVEIPQNLRGMWEEAFPDKTWAERKALYNAQL